VPSGRRFKLIGQTSGLTSVAVSDLDNGTDGELITWDSSGVADTVAAGTSGHVLTSNGAGAAPTFQASAGGGGDSEIKFLTSQQSVTSSATLVDVTELSGFTLDADSWYAVEGGIGFTSSTAGDSKFGFTWTNAVQAGGFFGLGGARSDGGTCGSFAANVTLPIAPSSGSGGGSVNFNVAFRSNATTGGTMDLQFAQRAANGTALVLQTGCWMKVTKLG